MPIYSSIQGSIFYCLFKVVLQGLQLSPAASSSTRGIMRHFQVRDVVSPACPGVYLGFLPDGRARRTLLGKHPEGCPTRCLSYWAASSCCGGAEVLLRAIMDDWGSQPSGEKLKVIALTLPSWATTATHQPPSNAYSVSSIKRTVAEWSVNRV